MDIYKIDNDGFRFQELDLEIDDFIEYFPEEIDDIEIHDFSKINLSFTEHWKLVRTGFSQIEGEENLIPDITTWIDATLVLSPKAHRYLADLLKPYGEFLPVQIGDETYEIFNCLTPVDANQSGEDVVFDNSSIGDKVVFKTIAQSCLNVFCTERFKNVVESFELGGVVFDQVR